MAWTFNTLVAEVAATLAAAGDTAPHRVGSKWLAANDSPPRYVWIPVRDTPSIEVPRANNNPRSIYSFREGISIHCWGVRAVQSDDAAKDFDVAWQMRNNVLVALRKAVKSDGEVGPSGFLDPERDNWIKHGQVYILNYTVGVPVANKILPTAEIQGTEHEGAMKFFAGEEVVC